MSGCQLHSWTLFVLACTIAATASCKSASSGGSSATPSTSTGGANTTAIASGSGNPPNSTVGTGGLAASGTGGDESAAAAETTASGGNASGGNASGGNASGGNASGGNASGGRAGTGSCEAFACPELGNCSLTRNGDQCTRVCGFDPEYSLSTASDVARLAALGCEVIEGALKVSANEIGDLAGLETIRKITGALEVANAGNLDDLRGLAGLEEAGSIAISESDQLESVQLPKLGLVNGTVLFVNLPSVDLIQLPSLRTVAQPFTISGNDVLASCEMNSLESVAEFAVGPNPELLTLHGLPALSQAARLRISGNPKLPQCEVDAIAERTGARCTCNANDSVAACDGE